MMCFYRRLVQFAKFVNQIHASAFIYWIFLPRTWLTTIAILPGVDGREVSVEAMKILEVIQNHSKYNFNVVIPCGGQNYLETGEEWAEGSFDFCRDGRSIFLGAIGYPGARPQRGPCWKLF